MTPAESPGRASADRRVGKWGSALLAVALAAVLLALWRNWAEVRGNLGLVEWPFLLSSLVLAVSATLLT
jgi:hypothetical protein